LAAHHEHVYVPPPKADQSGSSSQAYGDDGGDGGLAGGAIGSGGVGAGVV
jgi:hypothetical protein